MIAILSALGAILPIIGKLLDIFTKTPDQKLGDISKGIIKYLDAIAEGIKFEKEHPGDTSKLEDAINRRNP